MRRLALLLAVGCFAQQRPLIERLSDLLTISEPAGDAAATHRIQTVAEWERKRANIRARVLDMLGRAPEATAPLAPRVLGEEKMDGYVRRKVEYASATGDPIPAYLLLPDHRTTPAPAVLALHQTWRSGKDEVVGIDGSPDLHYGAELARRGYIVLAPDSFPTGERVPPGQRAFDSAPFEARYPDWSPMGKMLADHQRGLDYLLALGLVDGERIAVIGHSLGAYNAFFLAALDARVKAAIASCGFSPLAGSPKPFAWARAGGFAHFPKLRLYLENGTAPFDFHEVLALVAPRPLFSYSARQDRIFPNAAWMETGARQVAQVYRLYGEEPRFRFAMGAGGHGFPPDVRREAYEWLDQWCKK